MRLQGHHQRLSNASTIESESEIANMLSLARQVNGQHQKKPQERRFRTLKMRHLGF